MPFAVVVQGEASRETQWPTACCPPFAIFCCQEVRSACTADKHTATLRPSDLFRVLACVLSCQRSRARAAVAGAPPLPLARADYTPLFCVVARCCCCMWRVLLTVPDKKQCTLGFRRLVMKIKAAPSRLTRPVERWLDG